MTRPQQHPNSNPNPQPQHHPNPNLRPQHHLNANANPQPQHHSFSHTHSIPEFFNQCYSGVLTRFPPEDSCCWNSGPAACWVFSISQQCCLWCLTPASIVFVICTCQTYETTTGSLQLNSVTPDLMWPLIPKFTLSIDMVTPPTHPCRDIHWAEKRLMMALFFNLCVCGCVHAWVGVCIIVLATY